jgi:beta-glucosidase
VLATAKHFVGDGGVVWGTSRSENYLIDRGDTQVDEDTLRSIHLSPYLGALEAGAQSVMVSFSSWNGTKLHEHQYLISEVLKGELGFEGFVVSDWAGIDEVDPNYYEAVVSAINAGIDMNMVPSKYDLFIMALTAAVENQDVPIERIDDAVRRILRVKFMLGLFEQPFSDSSLQDIPGSQAHRELAREAVARSLVLLQNDSVLPASKELPFIFVAGDYADDIGVQSGGWTIEWQGARGAITPGTTILEAIQNTVGPGTQVQYNRFGKYDRVLNEDGSPVIAPLGIVVIGESPYSEGVGDREDLFISETDASLIARVGERVEQLVVILVSGRPLIISEHLPLADAWVAAWLPGTEGQGVADVLFGDLPFQGKLSFSWPRSMDQLPLGSGTTADPLYPLGYGLETNP